jgi:hypothetical protein
MPVNKSVAMGAIVKHKSGFVKNAMTHHFGIM